TRHGGSGPHGDRFGLGGGSGHGHRTDPPARSAISTPSRVAGTRERSSPPRFHQSVSGHARRRGTPIPGGVAARGGGGPESGEQPTDGTAALPGGVSGG